MVDLTSGHGVDSCDLSKIFALPKQKFYWTKLNRQGQFYSRLLQQGERLTSNSTKKKMVGEILGPKILGHLYLLIEFTPPKIKLSLIFMTGGSFTTLIRTH